MVSQAGNRERFTFSAGVETLVVGACLFWAFSANRLFVAPAMKQFSATSCPWDLAIFGGRARYVSHWSWGAVDDGNGHCFPAGHAVAAFAFLGMHFLWRRHDRARGRAWLAIVMVLGALLGVGQLARGAHYPSHIFWSAWICWAICAGATGSGLPRRPARGITLIRRSTSGCP